MKPKRLDLEHAEGYVPEVSVEGTAYECGRMLGHVWQDTLPKRSIYTHANAVVSGKRLQKHETEDPNSRRSDSLHRQTRLRERLEADHGRLTPQLALYAMVDHTNYPTSICRHQNAGAFTGGAVVAEPTRGLLHCTRGQPCRNWPRTYQL